MYSAESKYEKLMKIGEGAYGAVYKARDLTSNRLVALKITKFDIDDEGFPSTTLRELSILKTLNHPNIVKLLDVQHTKEKDCFTIQLAFQYMEEDLGKYIKRRDYKNVKQAQYKSIFRKIVEGIQYMHMMKIYHRDLKPQNILINSSNYGKQVRIADFGLSRAIYNPDKTYSKEIETLWYRSPQLLLGIKHYGTPVDVWSLGCIFYELAQGNVLFKGESQIGQIFIIFEAMGTPKLSQWPSIAQLPYFKGTFPKMHGSGILINNISQKGRDLFRRMIELNCEKRITVDQILAHPFFSEQDDE